jgi:hypothetical protein
VKEDYRANDKPGLLGCFLRVNVAATLYRRVVDDHKSRFIPGNAQEVAESGQGFNVVDDWLNRDKDKIGGFGGFKRCLGVFAGAVEENQVNAVLSSLGKHEA